MLHYEKYKNLKMKLTDSLYFLAMFVGIYGIESGKNKYGNVKLFIFCSENIHETNN